MYLTNEVKREIFKKHGGSEANSGGAESQIALYTHRITHLTEHLKKNKKDTATEKSLMRMVGRRKKLLNYVKKNDIERYRSIIKELGLRK
jgi:small subunit ribosomal protein S15